MEPNNQNNNPAPQNQPPQQAPVPQPPQPPNSAPTPATSYPAPPKSSKKTVWLIVGGILGGLLLIALIIFGIVAYATIQREQRAASVVDEFYTQSLKGPSDKLYNLFVKEGRSETFIDNAAANVDTSCKADMETYESGGTTDTATIKGVCPDSDNAKWNFTLVTNDAGDWKIQGLVFSGGKTSKPAATNHDTLACLQTSDVDFFPGGVSTNVYQYFYNNNLFFNADATSYVYPSQSAEKIQDFANFYKAKSNKAFTFHIRGSVNEQSQTEVGKKLANERASKIKDALMAKGVPASRISIDKPVSVNNQNITEASRNVTLEIKADKNCVEGSDTSGK